MDDQRQHWGDAAKHGALASVIDPNDRRGMKNLYISNLRDDVLQRRLPSHNVSLLDFGCGSGNLSKALASRDRRITGIDITPELLELAVEQNDPETCKFVHYDGGVMPFADRSFDFVVTYVVLSHIVDNEQLLSTLTELHRTLKDQGEVLFIEQTRRQTTTTPDGIKKQRNVAEYVGLFERAGFEVASVEHVRKARFLPLYLIRYGLIGEAMFPLMRRLDSLFATLFPAPRTSYVDTLFALRKQRQSNG